MYSINILLTETAKEEKNFVSIKNCRSITVNGRKSFEVYFNDLYIFKYIEISMPGLQDS